MLSKAVFLDRDGVINKVVMRNGLPCSPRRFEELHLIDGIEDVLNEIRKKEYLTIIVTNQPELERGLVTLDEINRMHNFIKENLSIDDIYMCVHDNDDECDCRKPKSGMLLAAAEKWKIDLKKSFIIGDRWKDVEAGENVGCCSVLIDAGYNKNTNCNYRISKISDFLCVLDNSNNDEREGA